MAEKKKEREPLSDLSKLKIAVMTVLMVAACFASVYIGMAYSCDSGYLVKGRCKDIQVIAGCEELQKVYALQDQKGEFLNLPSYDELT